MANKVSYVKNDEPAFIKALKQKTGYKKEPTVDSKREELAYEDEDRSDNEDEKPVVVVLEEGDLTAEEAQETRKYQSPVEDEETEEDGRITFKKPTKRQSDIKSDLNVSSSKKQRKDRKKTKSPSKVVKNSSLLSFDDDEEDT